MCISNVQGRERNLQSPGRAGPSHSAFRFSGLIQEQGWGHLGTDGLRRTVRLLTWPRSACKDSAHPVLGDREWQGPPLTFRLTEARPSVWGPRRRGGSTSLEAGPRAQVAPQKERAFSGLPAPTPWAMQWSQGSDTREPWGDLLVTPRSPASQACAGWTSQKRSEPGVGRTCSVP